MDNDYLGVVILNYKDYRQTIICVDNYLRQKNVNLKIVVVDNNSPNESYFKLESTFRENINVSVINSGFNGGYAFGNNFGVRYILNKFQVQNIIISNSDVNIGDSFFLHRWNALHTELDSVGITSPKMLVKGVETNYSAWNFPRFIDDFKSGTIILEKLFGDDKKLRDFSNISPYIEVDCLPGCLLMVDSVIFQEIGMFDEGTFLYMEEVILAFKLVKCGRKNYLLTKLDYEHLYSATISSVYDDIERRKIAFFSQLFYAVKYRKDSLAKILVLILSHLIGNLVLSAKALLVHGRNILKRSQKK